MSFRARMPARSYNFRATSKTLNPVAEWEQGHEAAKSHLSDGGLPGRGRHPAERLRDPRDRRVAPSSSSRSIGTCGSGCSRFEWRPRPVDGDGFAPRRAGGLVPLILIASAVLWRASRRWALLLPILMAGTGALQLAGKWAADRPRPNAAPWGFPSGHVLSLVVFFGVMAFLVITLSERQRRLRVLACFSCGVVVGLVAVSRIYLDMHWLSDVIGGFTLGSAYLLIALWASQLIPGRFRLAQQKMEGK